jgi:hypothetical protein
MCGILIGSDDSMIFKQLLGVTLPVEVGVGVVTGPWVCLYISDIEQIERIASKHQQCSLYCQMGSLACSKKLKAPGLPGFPPPF